MNDKNEPINWQTAAGYSNPTTARECAVEWLIRFAQSWGFNEQAVTNVANEVKFRLFVLPTRTKEFQSKYKKAQRIHVESWENVRDPDEY